jgi:glycosyltransferase involved in cell wall biosynthesis
MTHRAGDAPLVSVVTPCHNAETFVAETIESVLAQTHPRVEQVVVDDGSSDGSWEVVRRYAALHPGRVRGVRLEGNRGGCHARNRGVREAGGEFLMFLDADDTIEPQTLGALVEAARGRPGALAVCDWAYLSHAPAGWVESPRNAAIPAVDPDGALRGWLEGYAWSPTSALLWPRAVFERTGGWNESLARNQDGDITMRALAAGAPVVFAPDGKGIYRLHGETRVSVSRNFVSEEKFGSQVQVLDGLAALLDAQGRLRDFARPLGFAYQHTAWRGFQQGFTATARACRSRGIQLAGQRLIVSPRLAGRVLERVLGLEWKERAVRSMASLGLMTGQRRGIARLRELVRTGGGE